MGEQREIAVAVRSMAGTPEHKEAERAFAIIGAKATKIDAAKLADFLRALGQVPTQAEVSAFPKEADFEEAWSQYNLMSGKKKPVSMEAIQDMLNVFSKGGGESGEVKFADLQRCLTVFGKSTGDNLTAAEVASLKQYANIDDNAGGVFRYQDFLDMMIETQRVHTTSSVGDISWPVQVTDHL